MADLASLVEPDEPQPLDFVDDTPAPTGDELNLDSLLDEMDDLPEIKANVSAPVFGDDDINMIGPSVKKSPKAGKAAGGSVKPAIPVEEGGEDDEAELPTSEALPVMDAAESFSGEGSEAMADGEVHDPFAKALGSGSDSYIPGDDGEPSHEGDAPAELGEGEAESSTDGDGSAAVDPLDVFSNMDAMDFADDSLDDEMKAMLEDDEGEPEDAVEEMPGGDGIEADAPQPSGGLGRIRYQGKRALGRFVPKSLLKRIVGLVAWRENWWFYCDLLAAIIASASLAVIISYLIWYRN